MSRPGKEKEQGENQDRKFEHSRHHKAMTREAAPENQSRLGRRRSSAEIDELIQQLSMQSEVESDSSTELAGEDVSGEFHDAEVMNDIGLASAELEMQAMRILEEISLGNEQLLKKYGNEKGRQTLFHCLFSNQEHSGGIRRSQVERLKEDIEKAIDTALERSRMTEDQLNAEKMKEAQSKQEEGSGLVEEEAAPPSAKKTTDTVGETGELEEGAEEYIDEEIIGEVEEFLVEEATAHPPARTSPVDTPPKTPSKNYPTRTSQSPTRTSPVETPPKRPSSKYPPRTSETPREGEKLAESTPEIKGEERDEGEPQQEDLPIKEEGEMPTVLLREKQELQERLERSRDTYELEPPVSATTSRPSKKEQAEPEKLSGENEEDEQEKQAALEQLTERKEEEEAKVYSDQETVATAKETPLTVDRKSPSRVSTREAEPRQVPAEEVGEERVERASDEQLQKVADEERTASRAAKETPREGKSRAAEYRDIREPGPQDENIQEKTEEDTPVSTKSRFAPTRPMDTYAPRVSSERKRISSRAKTEENASRKDRYRKAPVKAPCLPWETCLSAEWLPEDKVEKQTKVETAEPPNSARDERKSKEQMTTAQTREIHYDREAPWKKRLDDLTSTKAEILGERGSISMEETSMANEIAKLENISSLQLQEEILRKMKALQMNLVDVQARMEYLNILQKAAERKFPGKIPIDEDRTKLILRNIDAIIVVLDRCIRKMEGKGK